MIAKTQVYKCGVCGNIVEVLFVGGGTLVCCGQPMTLMSENTADAAKEKHIPVLEKTNEGWQVTVGAVAHPMEEKHYIQWIELIANDIVYRAELKPGDSPKAFFPVKAEKVVARAYCNLHGLWKAFN
jgi:superoxide reductase